MVASYLVVLSGSCLQELRVRAGIAPIYLGRVRWGRVRVDAFLYYDGELILVLRGRGVELRIGESDAEFLESLTQVVMDAVGGEVECMD